MFHFVSLDYPDINPKKGKRKCENKISLIHEYRCKNSKRNFCKPKPARYNVQNIHDQVRSIPGIQCWFTLESQSIKFATLTI